MPVSGFTHLTSEKNNITWSAYRYVGEAGRRDRSFRILRLTGPCPNPASTKWTRSPSTTASGRSFLRLVVMCL